jgi:lipid II:glycine glycyltransferase (peptidoglycan interpeptide bridge formation enzyme)
LKDVFALSSGLSFQVEEHLSESEIATYLEQTDYPTVWSLNFLRSLASERHRPVLFRVTNGGTLSAMALGMFSHRFLRSHLLLPTHPRFLDDNIETKSMFWRGLEGYCRKHLLVRVSLKSYETLEPVVPELTGLNSTKARSEYFIDLTQDLETMLRGFSSSHRRNIKKAMKHELSCTVSQSEASLQEHLAAFSHTAARRQTRNESIPSVNESLLRKLLASKDAFMMQLHQNSEIVSSMYIISTPKSAFYLSGGTTPEGTKMGAFQYLIWLAIGELKNRGVASLTLGGTDADTPEGLRRFKLGFNAADVPLANYEYSVGVKPLQLMSKLTHI